MKTILLLFVLLWCCRGVSADGRSLARVQMHRAVSYLLPKDTGANAPWVLPPKENRSGAGPEWRVGQLGHNALAGLVMRWSEREDAVSVTDSLLQALRQHVEDFGAPDTTWDLVWLAVFFAESGDEACRARVPGMIEKLLQAQVRSGAAEGMWGPLAIDPERLAALWEAREPEKLAAYTQLYRESDPFAETRTLREPGGKFVSLYKPPEYPFHGRTVDLESTWLALVGIRVAKEQGLLPRSGVPGSPAMSAVDPVAAVTLAGRALLRLQDAGGAFHEANLHVPVTAFDGVDKLSGVPVKADSFPVLASPVTLASTAQGISAMDQVLRIFGERGRTTFEPRILLGLEGLAARIPAMIQAEGEGVGDGPFSVGMLYAPLMAVSSAYPGREELLAMGAESLEDLQRQDGGWAPFRRNQPWMTSVWRERARVLPERNRRQDVYDEAFVPVAVKENGDIFVGRMLKAHAEVQPQASTALLTWGLLAWLEGK